MPYCTRCGARLPEDKEAKFCPSCGAPLTPRTGYEKVDMLKVEARKERKVPPLKNRVIVMAMIVILCFAATSLGALSKVEQTEAQDLIQDLKKLEGTLEVAGVQIIFGNNLMHCLIMFIPVLGPFYGFYVLYSTGRVLAAMGSMMGADPLFLFINLFIYPYSWMEYLSYSLAISESFWLFYLMVKHGFRGFRSELTNASKIVTICTVLLLLAALVEMFLISSISV